MKNQILINKIIEINNKYCKKNGKARAREFGKVISDDLLLLEYINNNKTIKNISEELGVTWSYIEKRLKKITKLRPCGESYKNEFNNQWKGNNVGLKGLHRWIKRHKPKPELCEECNKRLPFELANVSGLYKREINDFRWLCRSCHSKEHRGKEWNVKMSKIKANRRGKRRDYYL